MDRRLFVEYIKIFLKMYDDDPHNCITVQSDFDILHNLGEHIIHNQWW